MKKVDEAQAAYLIDNEIIQEEKKRNTMMLKDAFNKMVKELKRRTKNDVTWFVP